MPIVNGYATRDELKEWVRLDPTDSDFDDLLDKAINASSRGIDKWTRRHYYQVDEPRRFAAIDACRVWFGSFNDLVSVTALATDDDGDGVFETVWTAADYELQPVNPNAAPEPKPYRRVKAVGDLSFPVARRGRRHRVELDGMWGWPAIPDAIIEGTLLQSARLFKRREAPEGVVGLNMFGTVRMGQIDGDVKKLVKPYRLRAVG